MNLKQISFFQWAILVVFVLGCVAYGHSLSNPFIWDDGKLIVRNQAIQSLAHLPQLFQSNVVSDSSFYRPFQMMTYALDYEIWGLNPKGFHFTSLIIHILTSLALCWVVLLLTQKRFIALFSACLFLVHPVHTEAVVYVSGRAEPLVGLFMLLTFGFYMRYLLQDRFYFGVLAMLSYGCALLSKEYAVILPLFLILYHVLFSSKGKKRLLVVLSSQAFLFLYLRLSGVLGVVDMHTRTQTTWMQRMPGTAEAMAKYVHLLFFPQNLSMGYGQKLTGFSPWLMLSGCIVLFGLCISAFLLRKKHPIVSFGLFWYFIGLFPVMNIYPVNAYMAEHWLYVPSMGLFLIAAYYMNYIWRSDEARPWAMMGIITIIGMFTFFTIQQNHVWQDPKKLYNKIISVHPNFTQAYNNLGKVYTEENNYAEALLLFEKAIEKNPFFVKAYNNAAVCLAQLGQTEKAQVYYQKALQIDPDFTATYMNLGVLYMEQDQYTQAEKHFLEAMRKDPRSQEIYYNLGILSEKRGLYEKAIEYYQQAVKINPNYSSAHKNLGAALSRRSEKDKAIDYYQMLIQSDPDNAELYNNLGVLYMQQNRFDEAVEQFSQALSRNRNYAEAHYNIGSVFYHQKSLGQAMRHLQDALASEPEHLGAITNLGIVYAMQNKLKQSENMFKQSLYLNPDEVSVYNNLGLVLARQGRYPEAIQYYHTAIEKDPEHVESLNNLALAYEQSHRLEEAQRYYEKVLMLDPQYINALNGLGVVYARTQRYDQAVLYFKKILNINPQHQDALKNLKRAQNLQKQRTEAL